jgi:hypothetical protein
MRFSLFAALAGLSALAVVGALQAVPLPVVPEKLPRNVPSDGDNGSTDGTTADLSYCKSDLEVDN